jgi:hypothetical protein
MIQTPAMRSLIPFSLILLLAACGGGAEEQSATVDDNGKIDCRVGADTQFTRFCSIERSRTEQGMLITVRKPDGGFRRLLATRDGRGVVAADGAEQAEVVIVGENLIEVAIAGDTFRLPARIGPVSPAQQ